MFVGLWAFVQVPSGIEIGNPRNGIQRNIDTATKRQPIGVVTVVGQVKVNPTPTGQLSRLEIELLAGPQFAYVVPTVRTCLLE